MRSLWAEVVVELARGLVVGTGLFAFVACLAYAGWGLLLFWVE